MNNDTVVVIGILLLVIFCAGDPDLLDGLVHNLYRE